MVKFSVVIPIFNSEYLKECLDSVISQTFKDFEIICIKDGSTDDSETILKEYANKDNRIKIYYQEHKGQGAARNYKVRVTALPVRRTTRDDNRIAFLHQTAL